MSQSIINMANAMYSLQRQPQHDESEDRLDAAQALLGVSPASLVIRPQAKLVSSSEESDPASGTNSNSEGEDSEEPRRARSDSAGLEALAFLATKEQATIDTTPSSSRNRVTWDLSSAELLNNRPLVASAVSSSSSSDDESMPPPPPRRGGGRRRSVSNPEGMEKWAPRDGDRLRFVIPASILEEELAEASAAMKAKEERLLAEETEKETKEAEDEEILDQDELLRRARSRLLEDLSAVNLNGDKGVLTLPHSLAKYKEVYNKNGRIGIYTPAERAAIIARFHSKRSRRVWNKKIRYNCRKNLADRRMRVKGRFVKRSTEARARMSAGSGKPSVPSTIPEEGEGGNDAAMPDVTDPDAGFIPTKGQPFRRVRRYTIT